MKKGTVVASKRGNGRGRKDPILDQLVRDVALPGDGQDDAIYKLEEYLSAKRVGLSNDHLRLLSGSYFPIKHAEVKLLGEAVGQFRLDGLLERIRTEGVAKTTTLISAEQAAEPLAEVVLTPDIVALFRQRRDFAHGIRENCPTLRAAFIAQTTAVPAPAAV